MSMSTAASTTVIPDGHSAQLFGVADARAQIAAERQAAGNALALCHDGAYSKGKNLKVTAGSNNSASLRVCCSQALKEVAAVSGSHRVTVTPWGVVIHLDRPVEGKA